VRDGLIKLPLFDKVAYQDKSVNTEAHGL
jgi:hypothetical protein